MVDLENMVDNGDNCQNTAKKVAGFLGFWPKI